MNAQPNKFQFVLNPEGINAEVLVNAPDDWLGTAVTYKRSPSYKGLFRGLTLPTKFVTQGANILRNEFYTKGLQANTTFQINQLNPASWAYYLVYSGKIDYSTSVDELKSFTANAISDDFSVQLNANESTDYAISFEDPLTGADLPESINLQLTPLTLSETATLIPSAPPDGNIHSDYFPPIQVVNNQQNSVNYSTQSVQYSQTRDPDFATNPYNFFHCRFTGKIKLTGAITFRVDVGDIPPGELQLLFINQSGTTVFTIYDASPTAGSNQLFTFNNLISVNEGDLLFLYMRQVNPETANTGITIKTGQINLAYNTISPPTMCKALPASYVFAQCLQNMNTNTDSGPNQPVPYNSTLLTSGVLSGLYITCSDSIKLAQGSIIVAGDTVFPGTYKVLSGTVNYGGVAYTSPSLFAYDPSILTFTGNGVAQKVVSGFIGAVYNPGDTLQAGGTYLVGGNTGTYITYNAINYPVGQYFTYVLGINTFTGSDPDSSFVEQTGASPQIITNFKDFFKSINAVMGGNCAFGIETVNGTNRCFIETIDYVYRGTIGNLNAGIVDTAIKIKPATSLLYNSIKVGYNDQQYSQLNGFSEVNSYQVYTSTLANPNKQLDLVSTYRADPYGIEEIRISQNDTAASRSDNDTFFIYIDETPVTVSSFTYYNPLGASGLMINPVTELPMISGVDPSYYNWILSPKQNLLRGGQYLASIFYNMQGYSIPLSAAPKNTALVTTDINGNRVAEADPLKISSLPAPVFLPYECTFKPGLPKNALQMIDSVPFGFISFTFNGIVYKMFADSVTVNVGDNTEQEFTGLLTPANDLTTLIR